MKAKHNRAYIKARKARNVIGLTRATEPKTKEPSERSRRRAHGDFNSILFREIFADISSFVVFVLVDFAVEAPQASSSLFVFFFSASALEQEDAPASREKNKEMKKRSLTFHKNNKKAKKEREAQIHEKWSGNWTCLWGAPPASA